jgi:hypothetical protein
LEVEVKKGQKDEFCPARMYFFNLDAQATDSYVFLMLLPVCPLRDSAHTYAL